MRSFWHSAAALLLLPTAISAITLDCSHIRVDEQSFNLKKLGGPKTVHRVRWEKPSIENTTFTLDICKPLEKTKEKDKNGKAVIDCPSGTRICAKEYDYPQGSQGFVKRVIGIAGEYTGSDGRGLNPKYTRLKGSAANSDDKEGVIVELHGGKYPNQKSGTAQKAIIEFLCDKDVTGNEGFGKDAVKVTSTLEATATSVAQYGSMQRREDDDDEPSLPDLDEYKNLKFLSYKREGDIDVLRLRWKTKFACEGARDNPDPEDEDKSSGWGFFTWFIIVVFLLAAAYIIFGSWLNYNRYGARGWDLIPHGDTIRDIPYIIKDFGSNVADRVKGGDSRGGYSAV